MLPFATEQVDLSPEAMVARVNRLRYPKTVYDQGWIYGMWYCGTSFQKAVYYGQYPATFVKRISAMLQGASVLHLCCGRCNIPGAVNVDLHELPEADVIADVEALPFFARSFNAVVIDPPYSDEDASRYKVKRLINSRAVMREASRVLATDGWLFWLDEKYPSYFRSQWEIKGLIGVITGFERRTRVVSIFRKVGA